MILPARHQSPLPRDRFILGEPLDVFHHPLLLVCEALGSLEGILDLALQAGCALLVVLFKWLSMALVRRPQKKQVKDPTTTSMLMSPVSSGVCQSVARWKFCANSSGDWPSGKPLIPLTPGG
mgnify:CR=1 FL=1